MNGTGDGGEILAGDALLAGLCARARNSGKTSCAQQMLVISLMQGVVTFDNEVETFPHTAISVAALSPTTRVTGFRINLGSVRESTSAPHFF